MRKNSFVWPRDIADDPVSLFFEAMETLYGNYQSSGSSRNFFTRLGRSGRSYENQALRLRLHSLCHRRNETSGLVRLRNSAKIVVLGPYLCTRIWVRALISLSQKKPLWICQSGWSEIRNVFPVIRCVRWWPGTRISVLLRKRYQPGFHYVCDAGYVNTAPDEF